MSGVIASPAIVNDALCVMGEALKEKRLLTEHTKERCIKLLGWLIGASDRPVIPDIDITSHYTMLVCSALERAYANNGTTVTYDVARRIFKARRLATGASTTGMEVQGRVF